MGGTDGLVPIKSDCLTSDRLRRYDLLGSGSPSLGGKSVGFGGSTGSGPAVDGQPSSEQHREDSDGDERADSATFTVTRPLCVSHRLVLSR
ncbi:hypothetical protein [Flindersiella endophytica]